MGVNEGSCLRLVSAVLMDIAEDWQTAEKRYVTFSNDESALGRMTESTERMLLNRGFVAPISESCRLGV